MKSRALLKLGLAAHLLLVVFVASRDLLDDIAQGYTYLPSGPARVAGKIMAVPDNFFGGNPSISKEAIALYLNSAGIESGYSYFAPNVPANYKLVFQVHFPDGHVENALPEVRSFEAGLRLVGILDEIGRTNVALLRTELLRMLTYAVWKTHPDAQMIRAVFGVLELPAPKEVLAGIPSSYQFLFAADFRFRS